LLPTSFGRRDAKRKSRRIAHYDTLNMDHSHVQPDPWDADASVLHPKERAVEAGKPVMRHRTFGNGPSLARTGGQQRNLSHCSASGTTGK